MELPSNGFRGEKKREEKSEKAGVYRSERVYGAFSRSFTLPGSIDPTKIEAAFKDGVLTVKLPKVEAAKPKQIAVEIARALSPPRRREPSGPRLEGFFLPRHATRSAAPSWG